MYRMQLGKCKRSFNIVQDQTQEDVENYVAFKFNSW